VLVEGDMTSTPVNASVELTDGKQGDMVAVVVNPLSRKVTHVAVRGPDNPSSTPRLVPVSLVSRTDSGTVLLHCTTADLDKLEPFTEEQVRQVTVPHSHYAAIDPSFTMGPMPMETYYVTDEVERIPEGEIAIRSGTMVEATDGEAGHVTELVVERGTAEVTHLTLIRSGKEITLPLSVIKYVTESAVHIKLDRKALDSLPSVPARADRGAWAGVDLEMVGIVFDDPGGANDAMDFVKGLIQRGSLMIHSGAVLVKEHDGKTTVKERHDLDPKGGALGGAVLGGVLGLITGGLGLVAAPALGAGAGAIAGKIVDRGFGDSFLKAMAERLQPGKSGLLLVVQSDWVTPMQEALSVYGGVVVQQRLTDRMVSELLGAGSEPSQDRDDN
jgi:uncharacterized membrane protein